MTTISGLALSMGRPYGTVRNAMIELGIMPLKSGGVMLLTDEQAETIRASAVMKRKAGRQKLVK